MKYCVEFCGVEGVISGGRGQHLTSTGQQVDTEQPKARNTRSLQVETGKFSPALKFTRFLQKLAVLRQPASVPSTLCLYD